MKLAVRCHQGGWSWPQLAAVWQEADRLGFDGASLYDLLGPGVECWTALTALVALNPRLIGIPMVLAAPYRAPVLTAKMAATLDLLSHGRLVLGLGSGGAPADAAAHGIPWSGARTRARNLEESVQAMRLLWRGGSSFAGRFVQIEDAAPEPAPYNAGGPPVLIGGRGRRHLLRVAARVADLCNIGFELPLEEYKPYRALLAGYCAEAGRDPAQIGFTHNASVLLGDSTGEFEALLIAWAQQRDVTAGEARVRFRSALAGTPEMVAERLDGFSRAGFVWTFLVFQDLPGLDMLRLFARRVLPLLRS